MTFKEDIAADTWTGDGTEEKPYLLKTEEDLNHLAKYVNQGYSFEGKYFALDDDISLPNSWVGIGRTLGATGTAKGSQILPFSGILDGKGHTLTFAEGSCALFSYVREATVKNLNIQAPYMKDYALVSNYVVDYGTDDDYYQGEAAAMLLDALTPLT